MRKQNNSIADILNLKAMVAALSLLLRNSMSSETFQNSQYLNAKMECYLLQIC